MINHTRHIGIFNAQDWPVTLIGAGGIGAITAVTLAKMGVPELTVFDFDRVSDVNIATQFFRHFDVESWKTAALSTILSEYADAKVLIRNLPFDENTHPDLFTNPIIISAVDSISARRAIWEAVKYEEFLWYLDARMGAEVFQLYAVSGDEMGWYEDLMSKQDDSQVDNLPCTSKATVYCSCLAAAHIGASVRKIISGLPLPRMLSQDMLSNTLMVP
jgi:molybdopterin/thiamine biosynthesis adenylyltransferase